MKRCSKCETEKPLSGFSRNRARYDGVNGWCKSCMKVVRSLHPEYKIRQHIGAKAWRQRPKNKEKHRIEESQRRRNEPEKILARNKARVLHRKPCEVCNTFPAQAHHEDYAKPLDVRWLCPTHHSERHLRKSA